MTLEELREEISIEIAPFRKFRHVVHHGYGFQLEWPPMEEGIANIEDVFLRFKSNLSGYLQIIEKQ